MEKLRFYTRRSGWVAFRSKAFWLFFILGIAISGAAFIMNEMKFDINNKLQLVGLGIFALSIIILIIKIIICHSFKLFFYDSKVVIREGVLRRSERDIAFMGVFFVKIDQRFIDRIFKVGDIFIDLAGKYDIQRERNTMMKGSDPYKFEPLTGISNPKKLKKYLDERMAREEETSRIVY